jgi:hypothetical protein
MEFRKSLLAVGLFVFNIAATQAAPLYTLDYSDSHGKTWALNFDGTNKGIYTDNLSKASFYFNGVSASTPTLHLLGINAAHTMNDTFSYLNSGLLTYSILVPLPQTTAHNSSPTRK